MCASEGRSLRGDRQTFRVGDGLLWGDSSWSDERNRPGQPWLHGPVDRNAMPAGSGAAGMAPLGPGSFQKSRPLAGWRAPAARRSRPGCHWTVAAAVARLLFFFSYSGIFVVGLSLPFSLGVAVLLACFGKSDCCVLERFLASSPGRRRRGRLLAHSFHSRFSGDEKAPLRNGCRPGLGSCGVFLSLGPWNLELGCDRSERIKNHLCSPCCPDGRLLILR